MFKKTRERVEKRHLKLNYNSFISELDEFVEKFKNNEYQKALKHLSSLEKNIRLCSFSSFPRYDDIVNNLGIPNKIDKISKTLNSETGSKLYNINMLDMRKYISQTRSYLHVLNFLYFCFANSENLKRISNKISLKHFKSYGMILKEITPTKNCHGKIRYNLKDPEITLADTEKYRKVIDLFFSFECERLRDVCLNLFDENLEKIKKGSDKANAIIGNERNMFTVGGIEFLIELSNQYKGEFLEVKQKNLEAIPTNIRFAKCS